MKKFQAFIRKYFGSSESETNGFILLIPLMVIILFGPRIIKIISINKGMHSITNDDAQLKAWLAEIEANMVIVEDDEILKKESFAFNPNTVTLNQMISLGFSEKTAKRIEKYRLAGGSFKTKKDLLKIYGISKERVLGLSENIIIPKQKKKVYTKPIDKEYPTYKKIKRKHYSFELNRVTVDSLVKIKGLGPILSERIVKFRNRLGGFHNIKQLEEVYGLDSTVLKEISINTRIDSLRISAININTDSLKHLSKHPYISYKLAKTIIAYKNQHGPFKNTLDLKNIKIVTDSMFIRLMPYLELDN